MAKSESRYIQFYTAGSSACKVELRREQEWAPLPKEEPKAKTVIHIDPVAIIGFLVAVSMLCLMAVGINRLNASRQEVAVLEHYVAGLTQENQTLSQAYADGYDLEEIRLKALDMGMVPAEQIPQTRIQVEMEIPVAEAEVTAWSRVSTLLAGLFA